MQIFNVFMQIFNTSLFIFTKKMYKLCSLCTKHFVHNEKNNQNRYAVFVIERAALFT